MGFESAIKNYIEKAVESAPSRAAFAGSCGVDPATLARYLDDKQRGLGFVNLAKIMDYIAGTGKLSVIKALSQRAESDVGTVISAGNTPPEGTGHIVPVYQFAAGGDPVQWQEAEPLCEVCIPHKFMFPGLLVMQVVGKSMEPLIRNGAYVGVNKHSTRLIPGNIYAVNVPYEGLTIKRVYLNSDAGELVLKPENPRHPDIHVPIEDRDGLIVGEVVWGMQEL